MNWYKIIKLAQIIEPSSGEFPDILEKMYEAEYKYSMMKIHPFNGIEQRKQSMLKILEDQMFYCIQNIRDVLLNVFKGWLDYHALLEPQSWATAREDDFDDYKEIESLEDAMREFKNYNNPLKIENDSKIENDFIKAISNNIDKIPSLQSFMEIFKQQYTDIRIDDITEKNKKERNKKIKEIKNYIKQMTFYDIYYDYYINLGNFIDAFKDYFENAKQLLIEIKAAVIFPLWFEKWEKQGIVQTRKNIQNIYDSLVAMQQGNSAVATISIALNAAHQTGSMLDYVEEFTGENSNTIRKILDNMTAGTNIPKWNEDLKKVGVQMNLNNQWLQQPEQEQIIKNPYQVIEIQEPKVQNLDSYEF